MKYDLSQPIDINRFKTYSESLLNGKDKVELKKHREKRTQDQNKYIHACFGIFADFTGYTVEESKILAKREFGRFMVYEKNGSKFLLSTSAIDTKQMTEFLDWFRNYSMEQGCYIMTPEEYFTDAFNFDKQLEHVQ